MVYSSVVFLFYFLPLLLGLYYLVPRIWMKNAVLFAGSLIFYSWAEGRLLFLLLAMGLSAWIFSYLIVRTRLKKLILYAAIILYILVLVYYKYLGFFADIFLKPGALKGFELLMPAGVSFFTFQCMSYLFDVYRNKDQYERNPIYIILYVSMFPQLISGPLIRYEAMGPQLKDRTFDVENFTEGIRRFIKGLAKKVLIADSLGLLVTEIMRADTNILGPSTAWIGMVAFTLQLFFDFSGYTDMAIGVGKMLGFELPENFNYPYISRSVTEFWRRWHITLSGWLRDYVFMPLSLNLRLLRKTGVFLSLFITFILCGMWHSPGWNFIIWGAIHGFFLVIEKLFLGNYLERMKRGASFYLLFIIITSFVFVATANLSHALSYLKVMFSPAIEGTRGPEAFIVPQHIALMIVASLLCIPFGKTAFIKRLMNTPIAKILELIFIIGLFLLSVMAVTSQTYKPFLYFKF